MERLKRESIHKVLRRKVGMNSSISMITTNVALPLLCLHGSGRARICMLEGCRWYCRILPLSKGPWGQWPESWHQHPSQPNFHSRADQINREPRQAGCGQMRSPCMKLQTWGPFKVMLGGHFPHLPCFSMSGEILCGAFTLLWGLMHGPWPKADFQTYQTNYFKGHNKSPVWCFYFHYYLLRSTSECSDRT